VEDADDISIDANGDELAGEGTPGAVPRAREDDPAVAVDLAQVAVGARQGHGFLGGGCRLLDDRLGCLYRPEPEPLRRGALAEGLVGRRALYYSTKASRACWACSIVPSVCFEKSSSRSLLWNRSTLPVVVGERTAVRRWVIPSPGRSDRTTSRRHGGRTGR
jgi:hypothetical protein